MWAAANGTSLQQKWLVALETGACSEKRHLQGSRTETKETAGKQLCHGLVRR